MYTPPVTPWESVTPEVSDPTPGMDEPRGISHNEVVGCRPARASELVRLHPIKEYVRVLKIRFIHSRGRELPKAGLITGVKS